VAPFIIKELGPIPSGVQRRRYLRQRRIPREWMCRPLADVATVSRMLAPECPGTRRRHRRTAHRLGTVRVALRGCCARTLALTRILLCVSGRGWGSSWPRVGRLSTLGTCVTRRIGAVLTVVLVWLAAGGWLATREATAAASADLAVFVSVDKPTPNV